MNRHSEWPRLEQSRENTILSLRGSRGILGPVPGATSIPSRPLNPSMDQRFTTVCRINRSAGSGIRFLDNFPATTSGLNLWLTTQIGDILTVCEDTRSRRGRAGRRWIGKDKPRRVFMVDDHAMVRRALCQLLESSQDLVVLRPSPYRPSLPARYTEARARTSSIIDLSMPAMGRFEATRAIHAALPKVKIIVQTIHKIAELVRVGLPPRAPRAPGEIPTGRIARGTALETMMRGELSHRAVFWPQSDCGGCEITAWAKKNPGHPRNLTKRAAYLSPWGAFGDFS